MAPDFSFLEDDPTPDDEPIRIRTGGRPRKRPKPGASIVQQLDAAQRSLDATASQMMRSGCSLVMLGGLILFVLWMLAR